MRQVRSHRSVAALAARASYHAPLSTQEPLCGWQTEQEQENQWHIPQLFRIANGNPGLRVRHVSGQVLQLGRRPISSARVGRKLLQQAPILLRVKVLRYP